MKKRYLKDSVMEDVADKMAFIGGPRQIGKTTFALSLLGTGVDESSKAYLNWDYSEDREMILSGHLPSGQRLIVFDEIHKYARWRNLIKGLYDKNKTAVSFIVTGSARLDYYRKGGDSLQGRYHYYRLHPFTLREFSSALDQKVMLNLLRFGGFPEPLLRGEDRFHRRWLREVSARVIYEDIRDLENVREVSMIELLLHHLPVCVGSPLSVAALSRLLQAAHDSIERWLEDTQGYAMELRYLRDTDQREIDFVVLRDGKPEFAVECKTGDRHASPACRYFRERTNIPRFYQTHLQEQDFGSAEANTRILPFSTFCKELDLP